LASRFDRAINMRGEASPLVPALPYYVWSFAGVDGKAYTTPLYGVRAAAMRPRNAPLWGCAAQRRKKCAQILKHKQVIHKH
jgi:hypothetical protein